MINTSYRIQKFSTQGEEPKDGVGMSSLSRKHLELEIKTLHCSEMQTSRNGFYK